MRRPAAMRIILPLLLLVAAGCVPAMSKAFIRDEDLASLRPDTSATCIVVLLLAGRLAPRRVVGRS